MTVSRKSRPPLTLEAAILLAARELVSEDPRHLTQIATDAGRSINFYTRKLNAGETRRGLGLDDADLLLATLHRPPRELLERAIDVIERYEAGKLDDVVDVG